jgi:peptidoglycan/xylan/chitin deacetylase (PgdA/CDA1 family)
MSRPVYVTIDDAPSVSTPAKVDLLQRQGITTIFFCRGEFLQQHLEEAIYAIHAGNILGNHSFSHPRFSSISLEDCLKEIARTEDLITHCYLQAGHPRPIKLFRFPFGDRAETQPAKYTALQQYLHSEGFSKKLLTQDPCVDLLWTIDSRDYKQAFFSNPSCITLHIEQQLMTSSRHEEVVLFHDFPHGHTAFEQAFSFLCNHSARLRVHLASLR